MGDWTRADFLALAAVVVGVIAIGVGVFAARRWGTRRGRLLFDYRSSGLLPEGDAHRLVKVTYRDFDVPDPHLVTLRLKNIGPRDIATSHFDGARPVRIDLNCPMYGLISVPVQATPGGVTTAAVGASDGFVEFAPALLKRDEEWVVEAIVQGPSAPAIAAPLVDTEVVEGEAGSAVVAREVTMALLRSLPLGNVLLALARVKLGKESTRDPH